MLITIIMLIMLVVVTYRKASLVDNQYMELYDRHNAIWTYLAELESTQDALDYIEKGNSIFSQDEDALDFREDQLRALFRAGK